MSRVEVEGEIEDNFYGAKLAEQVERYDDMVKYMKTAAVQADSDLSLDQRNLFSVAYKNVSGPRRTAWRIVSSLEQKEEKKSAEDKNEDVVAALKEYRVLIEKELKDICHDVQGVLKNSLIPKAHSPESQVFFHKMVGDYFRYLAEITTDQERKEAEEGGLAAYQKASDISFTELTPLNLIRQGLSLNFSVFYYEIMGAPDKAIRLAQAAWNDAVAILDSMNDESYDQSVMALLKDNVTLWESDLYSDDRTVPVENDR